MLNERWRPADWSSSIKVSVASWVGRMKEHPWSNWRPEVRRVLALPPEKQRNVTLAIRQVKEQMMHENFL